MTKQITKVLFHELLNLFKASQAIIIIFPYYIMLGVPISLIALIIFQTPDPIILINYIVKFFSPGFSYPTDDTELIMKSYIILTILIYLITLIYQKIRKKEIKRIPANKKIKIHLVLLVIAYSLFMIIILPIVYKSQLLITFFIYTILYLVLAGMFVYYFYMSEFVSKIQKNL